jgi:hypothetical protein
MKFKLTTCLLFFVSLSSFSQMVTLSDIADGGRPIMTNKGATIKGNPYLISDYSPSKVILSNGQYFDNLPIRYNVFEDLVEYENEGRTFFLEPAKVSEFTVFSYDNGKRTELRFKRGFSSIRNFSELNYFQVLYEGNYSWLLKPRKDVVDDVSASYGSTQSKVFQNGETLFFHNGNEANTFKRTKKSLLSLFEGNVKAIEVIKKSKLNLKENDQLILLLKEIDESFNKN